MLSCYVIFYVLCIDRALFSSSKVFHVRSVTQGDVIRADAKDIPRIFQLLYAGEGEARRPGESPDQAGDGNDHAGERIATLLPRC